MKHYNRILIGLAITSLAACSGNEQQGQQAPLKTYPVTQVNYATVTTHQEYPAKIEGILTVELRPKIQGYIDEIYVDEGAWVKKGQKLFKIFANEYTQEVSAAQANVEAAQAAVESAKFDVEKQRPLVEKQIISQYTLSTSEQNLASAKAQLEQAKAQLESARTNLSYTMITSPSDGVIGTIPYRIGSLVSSTITEPLTTIADIRKVRAYFSVNEKDFLNLSDRFSKQEQAKTNADAATKTDSITLIMANGKTFEHKGTIDAISGIINTTTGAATVRATFDNPQMKLRSGGSATIKIAQEVDSVIVVPQSATFEVQNKRFIYVMNDSNVVKTREIVAYSDDTGKQFIVQSGLEPNEVVVTDGINSLKSDMKIQTGSQSTPQ